MVWSYHLESCWVGLQLDIHFSDYIEVLMSGKILGLKPVLGLNLEMGPDLEPNQVRFINSFGSK